MITSLSSKSYNHDSAWQQHDGADLWYFGSIAPVPFTAVDFAFGDFHWGRDRFAVDRAASRWSVTSFEKAFNCRDWALKFYPSFGTAVLTVQTVYLYCTFSAFIPAVKRDTLVAFQGITWKKETNTKIELIAWIWKAVTPNYPIVTIQYFYFSTRKPFGIKWILNLWPSPHFFRQVSRRKTREMFYKPVEDWHNSVSSALLKEVAIFKQWSSSDTEVKTSNEKNRTARSEFLQKLPSSTCFFLKMKVTYRKLKFEVKVRFWEAEAPENVKGDSSAEGRKRLTVYRRCCDVELSVWRFQSVPRTKV